MFLFGGSMLGESISCMVWVLVSGVVMVMVIGVVMDLMIRLVLFFVMKWLMFCIFLVGLVVLLSMVIWSCLLVIVMGYSLIWLLIGMFSLLVGLVSGRLMLIMMLVWVVLVVISSSVVKLW